MFMYTTIKIIFRALIGKVGDKGAILRKNQEIAIVNSINKLRHTDVDLSDVAKTLKALKYTDKDGNEIIFKATYLLPADIIDAKINGQIMKGVIFFRDIPQLYHVADAKNQIIRYPHALMNVPNQNNTPRNIALKKYVIRRICEMKLHRNMTPTLTFADMFRKCRLAELSRELKRDARNSVINYVKYLKGINFIQNFKIQKRGNAICGVTFDLPS